MNFIIFYFLYATIGGGITNSSIMIFGDIRFTQLSAISPVVVKVNISFFPATAKFPEIDRGLHIHAYGISTINAEPAISKFLLIIVCIKKNYLLLMKILACVSAGDHWNPASTNHPDHAGDLGNVLINQNGKIITEINADKLQLFGENSIIGRSVVLHEKIDDLGKGNVPASLLNGNAGKRIACGSIAYEKP